jgi:hypothetical protein
MSFPLPSVRSVSGVALKAALDVIATVARWRDALPNDPDTIRDAAIKALAALELIREAPTATAARGFKTDALSEDEILALYAARNAWFRAGWRAIDRAMAVYGPDWGKVPGNRVYATVPRNLRFRYNRHTRKVTLDAAQQIIAAPVFWVDGDLPAEVTIGGVVPSPWQPDLARLSREGEIWSSGKWAKTFEMRVDYELWRAKYPDQYRNTSATRS